MILEFTIQNYRSYKDKYCLSLVADAYNSKGDNVFEFILGNGDTVRLLKSAVIYGPNASGKSNLLKAFQALQNIATSRVSVGDTISVYEPFLFDVQTRTAPIIFTLIFVGPLSYKYIYSIEYTESEILKETLDYYPKGQKRSLFRRIVDANSNSNSHTAKLGQDYSNKSLKVFNNQSILSSFGTEIASYELLINVFLYFKQELVICNNTNAFNQDIMRMIHYSPSLKRKLNKLIQIADTKISSFNVTPITKAKSSSDKNNNYYVAEGEHIVYDKENIAERRYLRLEQESNGTNVLFFIGAQILEILDKGGVLLIDEIDTSLHPKLAKFLVMLFQHPHANPKNAQLIFTTHETTFLDKDLFRKDQIWFAEKNNFGQSDLFSIQDFDGVREDTPFDKWYLAGKFGGLPNIQEIEFIFNNE